MPVMLPIVKSSGLVFVFLLSGCASVLDEDGALAIAPYSVEKNGRIVVKARVNGQGPYTFALDTAASISAVFDDLSNELALEPVPGKAVIVKGLVASGKYPLVGIDRVEIGQEVWVDPELASLPGESNASANIDGILGVDFLGQYGVGFAVRDRAVRLFPPDLVGQRSYRGWASISLQPRYIGDGTAAIFLFDVDLGDQRIPAVFDLGAGLNLINWAAARNLGFAPSDYRDDELLSGAIGTAPAAGWFRIDEMTTGRVRWRNEEFTIADIEIFKTLAPGATPLAILGAGLFLQRDFIIDFPRSRILVKVAMDEVDALADGDDAVDTSANPSSAIDHQVQSIFSR